MVDEDGKGADVELVQATMADIVSNISKRSGELIMADLRMILQDSRVAGYLDKIFPYLYAAGFLAYTGREMSVKSLEGVLGSAGFEADRRIAQAVVDSGVKNNIVYLHALYFLIVMGAEVSMENIRKVLSSIGIEADHDLSDGIMDMYKDSMLP